MDGFEVFHLGRKLMRLGEQSMPDPEFHRLGMLARTVLFDIAEHPGSSITDVTARVQLPQSQVSAYVSRLREVGAVEIVTDPGDRRRTLVRLTAEALARAEARPPAEIDTALTALIGTADPAEIQQAKDALKTLAALLRPRE
ncbi:DNA-binding MarR family transcriptional regulator [Actinocorallia herbida]|uniref:DNA-binding MarR family transcriptional regulator n=1 Tax=Actinocorallia herbida TaxID=58109 RepID=A0A3N1D1D7_9ACTN|nr:helix-turn-helix domain-containing protein [Actinocorallia herbida]ROO87339.1 DNA-binding MarR family transcriptional regulator [Actinocorallia herbida]